MRVIKGWIVIGMSYVITLLILSMILNEDGIPADLEEFQLTQILVGIALIVIPYSLGGIYSSILVKGNITETMLIALVPVIIERVCILGIGYMIVSSGGDGSMDGISLMMFIQGEAAPYFTLSYIWSGILSVTLILVISKMPVFHKKINKRTVH